MREYQSLFIIILFGLFSHLNSQDLEPIYPNSSIKPQISISFDKTVDLSKCCKRLAIVNIAATFDPKPSNDDEENTLKIVYSGYERNFIDFGFKLIERKEIETQLNELALSMSGMVSEESAIKAGKLLAAQVVCFININGFTRTPGFENFMTSFKLVHVETGKIVASGVNSNAMNGTAKMFGKFYLDYLENMAAQNVKKGYNFLTNSNADSAIIYYQAALNHFEKKEDPESKKMVGVLYNNIGAAYKIKRHWRKAFEWLSNSIEFNEDIDDELPVLANSYRHLCEINFINGNFDKAEEYGKDGLEICRINNDLEQECKLLDLLLKVFEKQGSYDKLEKAKNRHKEIFCQ